MSELKECDYINYTQLLACSVCNSTYCDNCIKSICKECKQQEEYVKKGGLNCPNCEEIQTVETDGVFESDLHSAWQDCKCTSCKATWTELYKITGFTKLSGGA